MDWIKIKDQDIPINMTDAELGKLIKYQLAIAKIERPMTENELSAFYGRKERKESYEKMYEKHQLCCKHVANMLQTWCKHVAKLQQKRAEYKRNSRLSKRNVYIDRDVPGVHPSRAHDNMCVYNNNINNNNTHTPYSPPHSIITDPMEIIPRIDAPLRNELAETMANAQAKRLFSSLWDSWEPKLRGIRYEVVKVFNENVVTSDAQEIDRVKSAFDEYRGTDSVRRNVIMRLDTWLKQWRNFLPEKERKESKDVQI